MSDLLQRLRDERDLCASEHAGDIANLLHETVLYITVLRQLAEESIRYRDALMTLVREYRAAPDGELGRGLTNGAFLRAEELLMPNARLTAPDTAHRSSDE